MNLQMAETTVVRTVDELVASMAAATAEKMGRLKDLSMAEKMAGVRAE